MHCTGQTCRLLRELLRMLQLKQGSKRPWA